MNTPYVKQYKDGVILNPITKKKPFLNNGGSRKLRREKTQLLYNEVLKRSQLYRLSNRGEWINTESVNAPKISKFKMNKLISKL